MIRVIYYNSVIAKKHLEGGMLYGCTYDEKLATKYRSRTVCYWSDVD